MPGDTVLNPGVEPLSSEFLDGRGRERVRQRLAAWLRRHLRIALAPLYRAADAAARGDLSGPARGLLYRLSEALGPLPRSGLEEQLRAVGKVERKLLNELGVRLGRACVHMPAWRKAGRAGICAQLWALHAQVKPPAMPEDGANSHAMASESEAGWYRARGFCVLPARQGAKPGRCLAIRVEALEQIAFLAYREGKNGPFTAPAQILALADKDPGRLEAILRALGYGVRSVTAGLEVLRRRPQRGAANGRKNSRNQGLVRLDAQGPGAGQKAASSQASPFDILRELTPGE